MCLWALEDICHTFAFISEGAFNQTVTPTADIFTLMLSCPELDLTRLVFILLKVIDSWPELLVQIF